MGRGWRFSISFAVNRIGQWSSDDALRSHGMLYGLACCEAGNTPISAEALRHGLEEVFSMKSEKILVIIAIVLAVAFVAEAIRAGHQVWELVDRHSQKLCFVTAVDTRSGQPLATEDNFSFQRADLNTQLSRLVDLIDRVHPR